MGKLIQLFPDAAKSVMDRCIHRSLAHRSITYDFSLLDPGPDDQSGPGEEPFFGLMDMVNHKQKELLVHDLSRKLLKIKWRTYGWFIFWTNLALFGFFLFLMTYFMLTQRKLIVLKKSHNAGDDGGRRLREERRIQQDKPVSDPHICVTSLGKRTLPNSRSTNEVLPTVDKLAGMYTLRHNHSLHPSLRFFQPEQS